MILKSLSRKGGAGAFAQLYDYIARKAEGERLWHNFLYYQPDRGQTVERFEQNSKLIKHSKRHNILYHEILSIKRGAKNQQARQMEALRDLSQQYLAKRAKGQLAYAAIHADQAETLHVHMMISANGVGSNRRVRLPKHEFLQIQKDLETSLQRNYPELEERTVYNKPWEKSKDLSNKEQNLKSRTKAPSKKDQLRDLLEKTFSHALSREEAEKALADLGVKLVSRGKNITAEQGTLKCRLKTLGLDEAYRKIGSIPHPEQAHPSERMEELNRLWKERVRDGRERER